MNLPTSQINPQSILQDFNPNPHSILPPTLQRSLHLARHLQTRAQALQAPAECKQQDELDRMLQHPQDKVTLMQMTDQAFRSKTPARAIDQLTHILHIQGIPHFFSPIDRTLLQGLKSLGSYLPSVASPLVQNKMQHETANVILPAEEDLLAKHLADRRTQGVRMNVNLLGEAITSEAEAKRRLDAYLQALHMPHIEVISVKISTLYSQINPLAPTHTLDILADRLAQLYHTAQQQTFQRADGSTIPKFVYLDMESYHDLHFTIDAFIRTLNRATLKNVSAGIVFQAYLPDSIHAQRRINTWARKRIAQGGAPITLRIVKGANMQMEAVDSLIAGWPIPTYQTKADTDANYKRMLHEALLPQNIQAVHLGVASHNLFDLAYALTLATQNNALQNVQFEMLEGMANHQRRALFELTNNMLLYAPACRHEHFINAIGYLIRRLDENTGPQNFLRHAFKITVDSDDWRQLENDFIHCFDRLPTLSDTPRRQQDRRQQTTPPANPTTPTTHWRHFINEPDTDFALPHHAQWAQSIIDDWINRHDQNAKQIPLVINNQTIFTHRKTSPATDPSRPGKILAHCHLANDKDIQTAIATAKCDPANWGSASPAHRSNTLANVANELRAARPDLMGAALADAGKTLPESDSEVSEAIDFVEFYRLCANELYDIPTLQPAPRGPVAVISPWNFPIAIPAGGIAAALAAGDTVILKPAPETILTAYHLCQCFWRGGISKQTLQFLPCENNTQSQTLATHPHIDTVILTGSTQTAQRILQHRPTTRLLAETGGKNTTIVTALADRDQAIAHIIQSAFSHAGQKCSATSLLILEDEVYHDSNFRAALIDAATSLQIGSAWNLANTVGPLIHKPTGPLKKALTTLEPGEQWALPSQQIDNLPNAFTPAIKWNVSPNSYTHLTEFFGPILAVMHANNLDHAISIANQTNYGLTAGLESLDEREQQHWSSKIFAGNLYINRSTTGAIVLRQPFGGMGKSAFGPGVKVGGPNYLPTLMNFKEQQLPPTKTNIQNAMLNSFCHDIQHFINQNANTQIDHKSLNRVLAAASDYDQWHQQETSTQHDHFRLLGQDNIRRYQPIKRMRIRIHPQDTTFDILARIAAALTACCTITISSNTNAPPSPLIELLKTWPSIIDHATFINETDGQLATLITNNQTDRLRYASPDRVPDSIRRAAIQTTLYIADTPIQSLGRIELTAYHQEQSLSINYHRQGNLGPRSNETRAPLL